MAAVAAFAAVVAVSCGEFVLWSVAGRSNEWPPIAGATLGLALGAGLLAAILTPLAGRVPGIGLAVIVPLVPFARHALIAVGLRDPWATAAAVVATAAGAFLLAALARRRLVSLGLAAVALVVLVAGWGIHRTSVSAPGDRPERTAPSIVLLVLDTTRLDALSVYGDDSETSPRLAAFARDALVYDNAWSVSPWTPPSHASMFTGLLPAEHGVDGRALPHFPRELLTIQRVLSEAGYRTGGFPANPNLMAPGWETGFDDYKPSWFVGNHTYLYFLNRWLRGSTLGWEIDRSTVHVLDRAREWWASNDGPRFLFLNVIDPHHPYNPPEPYFDEYLPGIDPADALAVEQDPLAYHGNPGITPRDADILRSLYDAEVESMDDQVGGFLQWLDERGDLGDTIVAITSDHGERLGESGVVGHDLWMDPFLLRVPLLIRYPRELEPGRIERPVQLDGLPGYLLHLAGVEIPDAMATSALHLRDRGTIVAQFQHPAHFVRRLERNFPGFDPTPYRGDCFFVAEDRFALTLRETAEGQVIRLSDWVADPELAFDLSAEHPETVERLREIADSLPRFEPVDDGEIDPRMLERLRTLGYVD